MFAFPLGVGARPSTSRSTPREDRFTRFINVNIRNLAGVPSIVYGILGLTIFVQSARRAHRRARPLIAAGLTLAILVLPIVIITVGRGDPGRAAVSCARRATAWAPPGGRSSAPRCCPTPLPGIITGTVLALARALGEAAPLILCGAVTGLLAGDDGAARPRRSSSERFTALPDRRSPTGPSNPRTGFDEIAAAAIIVMLVIVLVMNTVAILLRNRYEKKRT